MEKFYKTSESVDSNYFVLYAKKVGSGSYVHYEAYLDPDFEKGLTYLELAKICQSAKVLFSCETADGGAFEEDLYAPYRYTGDMVGTNDNYVPMVQPHVLVFSGGAFTDRMISASIFD